MEAAAWKRVDPALPPLPRRLEKPQSKSKFSWNLLVLAIVIGVGARALGPSWIGMLFQGVKLESCAALSAFAAAFAVGIILHEAGHLFAALLFNFEVLGATLGPIRATNFHGKWSFQPSGTFFSASVSAIPRDTQRWRERMLVVVAAGPAATFLTGVSCGTLLFSGHFGAWTTNFLTLSTELNVFLFVLGLIPNATKARVRNDARLCYSLFRNSADAQDILLYHLVTQLTAAGVRPRDYPERVIRKLAAARSRPDMSLIYAETITLWAIDCGDLQSASAWQQRALELSESCDLRLQNLTLAKSACFDVLFRNDLATAASKFVQVHLDVLTPDYFMHRAKAAYHLADGRIEEALAEVQRAKFSFPRRLPYYEFERSLLAKLHQKILEVAEQHRNTLFATSVSRAKSDCYLL